MNSVSLTQIFANWYFKTIWNDPDYMLVANEDTNRIFDIVPKDPKNRRGNWTLILGATQDRNVWVVEGNRSTRDAIHVFRYYYVPYDSKMSRFILHPDKTGMREIWYDNGEIVSYSRRPRYFH